VFRHGSGFDRWDLEVRGGIFGAARLRSAIEEHGGGRQLVRFRVWPRASHFAQVAVMTAFGACLWAAVDGDPVVLALVGSALLAIVLRIAWETSGALATLLPALRHGPGVGPEPVFDSAAAEAKPVLRLVQPEPATTEFSAGNG
jgi:hypothetical protein